MTSSVRNSYFMRVLTGCLVLVGLLSSYASQAALPLEKVKLPKGFSISVFAKGVKNARSLVLGANGTLFVGTRTEGKVYAITPAGKVFTIASGLNMPNGVAFRDGALFVAEIHRLLRFEKIESHLENPLPYKVISSDFPTDRHHGWKFIAFGPDGKLYIPIGAPCNVCDVQDPYAAILRLNADGSGREVFARGIRNTVGFDWHPITKELWFTDNGRDLLGDDLPPDELNRALRPGMHFGFPFCHGGDLLDPSFGLNKNCSDFIAPEMKLGAHVAAIGMRFYSGQLFPAEYRNQVIIAEHGSWNRSTPSGYRLTLVKLDTDGRAKSYGVFAEGWLQDGRAWGRPADVVVAVDGSLFVSDDLAGVVYRITYH